MIKQVEVKPLQVGLIHVPLVGTKAPTVGTVEAVGAGVSDVSVGDKVIWSKHQAVVKADGRLILKESDVLAVIG